MLLFDDLLPMSKLMPKDPTNINDISPNQNEFDSMCYYMKMGLVFGSVLIHQALNPF